MPGMSGRELAAQLLAEQPSIDVIYMSGYTDDAVMRHGIESDNVHFLPKPYSLTALTAKVREVLGIDVDSLEECWSPIGQSRSHS